MALGPQGTSTRGGPRPSPRRRLRAEAGKNNTLTHEVAKGLLDEARIG
jgi:hypothetical protein